VTAAFPAQFQLVRTLIVAIIHELGRQDAIGAEMVIILSYFASSGKHAPPANANAGPGQINAVQHEVGRG
jgi:hypothetical protein